MYGQHWLKLFTQMTSITDFEGAIYNAWVTHIYQSMPNRMAECHQNKLGSTT